MGTSSGRGGQRKGNGLAVAVSGGRAVEDQVGTTENTGEQQGVTPPSVVLTTKRDVCVVCKGRGGEGLQTGTMNRLGADLEVPVVCFAIRSC